MEIRNGGSEKGGSSKEGGGGKEGGIVVIRVGVRVHYGSEYL